MSGETRAQLKWRLSEREREISRLRRENERLAEQVEAMRRRRVREAQPVHADDWRP